MSTSTSTENHVKDRTKKQKAVRNQLLDELLKGKTVEEITGPDGLLKQLITGVLNRAMSVELADHLGYEAGDKPPERQANRRNGTSSKTIRTEQGNVEVDVPRDRNGTFEPKILPKHQRHFNGFDDKIVSMYARGMSTRDIRGHLEEIYGVDVSPDLISRVTDGVVEELQAWQNRPLESVYLVVYLDAMVVKIRDKGMVTNKAVYQAIGVAQDGRKEALGLWIQKSEGAKFWLSILTEFRQRGVQDILVLCADGLAGIAEAVEASFPRTIFQTCIVHMIRNSVRFVPWKDRKGVCADLRTIYSAPSLEAAEKALDTFEDKWGERFPTVVDSWRRRWSEVTPFLDFPPELRTVIYTTNAIEACNRQVRKVIKTRGQFPDDAAALKLIYLALRNAQKNWGRSRSWTLALQQFAVCFQGRFPNT